MKIEDRIKALEKNSSGTCFSISIPTVMTGDYDKNRIRWKNAVSKLQQTAEEQDSYDKAIFDKIDNMTSATDFWAHQKYGIAGYFSGNVSEIVKLNHETIPISDVSDTFNLYPLVSEQQAHSSVYILCISKSKTSLFLLDGGNLSPVDISENVVKDYDEAMNFDESKQSLQHHSGKGGDAIFHGNSAQEDMDDTRSKQYLRRIDDGLMEVIQGQTIPLVLACIDDYYPMYKEVTAYNHLHSEMISGNPDQYTHDEIVEKANCIMTDELGKTVTNFLDRYNETAAGDIIFDKLDDFRNAVKMKNVDSLLVNESKLSQYDSDEINKITRDIMQAYRTGAKVICVSDAESDHLILGINRFSMETTA